MPSNNSDESLTELNFSNYSTIMETQLNTLETKLGQLLELCQSLRAENQKLRQQVAIANDQNKQLSERVSHARLRMEALLEKIPEVDL